MAVLEAVGGRADRPKWVAEPLSNQQPLETHQLAEHSSFSPSPPVESKPAAALAAQNVSALRFSLDESRPQDAACSRTRAFLLYSLSLRLAQRSCHDALFK